MLGLSKLLGAAALFISLTSFAAADELPTLPAYTYGKLADKSLLTVSPDATKFAYRDTTGSNNALVILDTATNQVIKALNLKDLIPYKVMFASDDHLLFVVGKPFKYLSDRYTSSWAYAVDVNTGKMHRLLDPGEGIAAHNLNVGRISGISKDGRFAFMPAIEVKGDVTNLYKVNITKKRQPKLFRKGSQNNRDFFVNSNDVVVAKERYNQQTNIHRIDSYVDGKWRPIFKQETLVPEAHFYGLSEDERSLVVRMPNPQTGIESVYQMALRDGQLTLVSDAKKNVASVVTKANGDRIVTGVRFSGFTPTYQFFDQNLNRRMRGIAKAMPNNSIYFRSSHLSNNFILMYMTGEQSSGDFIVFKDGGLSMLASARESIHPQLVNSIQEYEFKARDGLTIPTLLTLPAGKEAKSLPAVVLPHDGPEDFDAKTYNYMAQFLASRGYLVVQPQYRGSTGFGQSFIEAGYGEWGQKMQDDLTDSVMALSKDGLLDQNRVCIVGQGYGGYAALAGAAFTPDLFQCAVAINGLSDIGEFIEAVERNADEHHASLSYWRRYASKQDVSAADLAKISPINYPDKINAAVLMFHGSMNSANRQFQAKDMIAKLKSKGKTAQYVELKNGTGTMQTQSNRILVLKKLETFLDDHLN